MRKTQATMPACPVDARHSPALCRGVENVNARSIDFPVQNLPCEHFLTHPSQSRQIGGSIDNAILERATTNRSHGDDAQALMTLSRIARSNLQRTFSEGLRAGTELVRWSKQLTGHWWWTPAQLIAHHNVGGGNLQPDNLLGS